MLDFGLIDVIDILLVAMLLYYIYKVMKQSAAVNIFYGIMVFIVVWAIVSQIFSMRMLGTIMDKLVSIGGIGLIILFQEELRRFFSTLGTQRLRFFMPHDKDEDTRRQDNLAIVLACRNMSRQKVGALIVIEHNVGLSEYINSGDNINANITQRLIENIFFKNSPLHDGALIIRKHRLAAAACILPVSHDADIPKALGLRHRAAMGIAQKSDALAVIVSEETGNISVAHEGQFHLHVTADELEQFLNANTEQGASPAPSGEAGPKA